MAIVGRWSKFGIKNSNSSLIALWIYHAKYGKIFCLIFLHTRKGFLMGWTHTQSTNLCDLWKILPSRIGRIIVKEAQETVSVLLK